MISISFPPLFTEKMNLYLTINLSNFRFKLLPMCFPAIAMFYVQQIYAMSRTNNNQQLKSFLLICHNKVLWEKAGNSNLHAVFKQSLKNCVRKKCDMSNLGLRGHSQIILRIFYTFFDWTVLATILLMIYANKAENSYILLLP